MARVTHVKAARQRYASVPVIDPATGAQKQTPVMRTRKVRQSNGEITEVRVQKTTKRGTPVFMGVTESDRSQPLPNHTCEMCGAEIKVGAPYKHVTPKSGPYGGRTRRRCKGCPTWQPWDLSNSLSARVQRIVHDAEQALSGAESDDDVTEVLVAAAEDVRSLAQEKSEAAENVREGFGHDTTVSEELDDVAGQLEVWADEIEEAWSDSNFDREEVRRELVEERQENLGDTDYPDDLDSYEEIDAEVADQWRAAVEDAVSVLGDCPV